MENKKNTNITKILSLIVLLAAVLFGVKEIGPVSSSSTNVNQIQQQQQETQSALTFRNANLLNQHYQKHGIEMGFASAEEYEVAASAVVSNPAALHKTEAEDGDDVYYVESTNEFVVVSTDGYIRTYFYPDAGIDYYNRQ